MAHPLKTGFWSSIPFPKDSGLSLVWLPSLQYHSICLNNSLDHTKTPSFLCHHTFLFYQTAATNITTLFLPQPKQPNDQVNLTTTIAFITFSLHTNWTATPPNNCHHSSNLFPLLKFLKPQKKAQQVYSTRTAASLQAQMEGPIFSSKALDKLRGEFFILLPPLKPQLTIWFSQIYRTVQARMIS